ncbi:hypothetical protein WN53_09055 [Serratia fonticola]|nr:hypothetical protein WN53_09055 [Serratia fonticola]
MVIGLSIEVAQADQVGGSVTVKFHGTLKRKPCHIDNDGDIYVHFGNVGINKVDGQHYIQPIPYTLTCEEPDPSLTLLLYVMGTQSSFDSSALKTNANGLGIQILQNGTPLDINKALTINYSNPPTLQAVPVKQGGVKLPKQNFSVTATLLAEYQ